MSKPKPPTPYQHIPLDYFGQVYLEGQVHQLAFAWDAYSEAWKNLIRWSFTAPSTADSLARTMYIQDVVNGTPFKSWYDEAAGRESGFNRPPKELLEILYTPPATL